MIFVTGAAGYLGRELAARSAGAAGSYLSTPPPDALARPVRLDIRDADAVMRALDELRPDVVIHTAYRQGAEDSRAVNVGGSVAVARAAAAVGARLVHMSSDLVFDGALGRPYRDDDEPSPCMEYGREKLDGERAVLAEYPAALAVRTSLIYGGAAPSNHEQLALDAASGAKAVTFFTDELRSPVQVGDLADAVLELAAGDLSGVLHVAGADGVSRHEFASLVVGEGAALAAGLAAEHPDPRPLDCRLDSSQAEALLKTRLRGVREVLCA